MGGRGSSGGGGGSRSNASKPEYFQETEKAVKLRIIVEDYDLEQTKSRFAWVPKSQLADDGKPGSWITEQKAQEFYSSQRASSQFSVEWQDANGRRFSASMTKKEEERARERARRFQAGVDSYNALIAEAKALGVKGVRVGMKRKTIERKIREKKNRQS